MTTPDFDFVVDALVALHQQMVALDPLLAHGIGLTWLCVLNPAMAEVVRREFAASPLLERPGGIDTLSKVCGRPAWIINAAPPNRVEYMPVSEVIRRYGDTLQPSDLDALKEIEHSYTLAGLSALRRLEE